MERSNQGWRGLVVWASIVALGWATWASAGPPSAAAADTGDSASEASARSVMVQQSTVFWKTVAASADDRATLLGRYFSPGLVQRRGEPALLETFAMLSEVLGPGIDALEPVKVLGNDREGEMFFTLADGRRVSLTLTLTDGDSPRIDGFGVRPLPPEVAAVKPEELPATIAAHVDAEFAADRFSGAVLVARGDELIHAQAVGMADRETDRPNTLDTPINLGSMNKMFTSIAIAQLQATGKLDWQDTVGKHLPEFPNAKIRDHVTIHQLLTHTSGVGSYWNDEYKAQKHEIDSQQEFLETFVDDPLLFEPGQGNEYSNGGPVILGLIIEALSSSGYYDYVRQHIYQPAEMNHADHYRRDDSKSGIALGYIKTDEGGWSDNREDLGLLGSAAGGGYASARDMYAFSRALTNQSLLTRDQLEILWTPHTQPGPIGYGYLFSVGDTAGKRWIGHNGGAPGISAEFMYYPEDGLVIIVLANRDNGAMAMREWLHALLERSLFENP